MSILKRQLFGVNVLPNSDHIANSPTFGGGGAAILHSGKKY